MRNFLPTHGRSSLFVVLLVCTFARPMDNDPADVTIQELIQNFSFTFYDTKPRVCFEPFLKKMTQFYEQGEYGECLNWINRICLLTVSVYHQGVIRCLSEKCKQMQRNGCVALVSGDKTLDAYITPHYQSGSSKKSVEQLIAEFEKVDYFSK